MEAVLRLFNSRSNTYVSVHDGHVTLILFVPFRSHVSVLVVGQLNYANWDQQLHV